MIKLNFERLAQSAGGRLTNNRHCAKEFEGVSIDSRTIQPSQLFIAIKGEQNDGHKYIETALNKKCAGLMVERSFSGINEIDKNVPVVIVENTHEAMKQLAANYRENLKATFIAISGSNGKTTSKEIVTSMIRRKSRDCYSSPGNLNNQYGLPLALFGMSDKNGPGIFELGISTPGEMTQLARILKPDLALITNIGPTHLETLGSVENVAEAKLELADSMSDNQPVILNADDPVLMHAIAHRKRSFVTYGLLNPADFLAKDAGLSESGWPLMQIDGINIEVKLFGRYQIYNILAGYAICRTLGLDLTPEDINKIDFSTAAYRGEIEKFEGITIVSDCYNANPVSMKAGLLSFDDYSHDLASANSRRLAVIGDMLELGEESEKYHREVGRQIAELSFELTYVIGPLSKLIYQSAIENGLNKKQIKYFDSTQTAGEVLLTDIARGDIVYFKASRGIGLEKIITQLKGAALRQN
jgi:UDP-N-acetylmuramoyl-tripeptide--D-alanyl-D-alanine ligase